MKPLHSYVINTPRAGYKISCTVCAYEVINIPATTCTRNHAACATGL